MTDAQYYVRYVNPKLVNDNTQEKKLKHDIIQLESLG